MDELRPEIRAAFEKEQIAHPPAAALRRNVIQAVNAQPAARQNLQWVAVAAAVILAILVVAGLMSTRFAHQATAPAATPRADYGLPPAGVNLLYVHDPSHPTWLIGYDWQGHPRATVKLDPSKSTISANVSPFDGVRMAPDGKSFAAYADGGATSVILDRFGQPVPVSGAISSVPNFIPTYQWADDNVHICGLSYDTQTYEWALLTLAPGETVKSVPLAIDSQGTFARSGPTGFVVLTACSVHDNRALITFYTDTSVSDMWVVRISDGGILAHHVYPPGLVGNVVASSDLTLIAEDPVLGQLAPTEPNTIIRRLSDMSVVAKLDPSLTVLGFNSDDSLAVVATTPWTVPGAPTAMAVIDLRSGQALWRYSGPSVLGGVVRQPGGRDFAFFVWKAGVPQDPLTDVFIVHADGTETKLPGRYLPPPW
jgi:hypothetical protein